MRQSSELFRNARRFYGVDPAIPPKSESALKLELENGSRSRINNRRNLANLVGGFDGAKAVGISKPGDYLLDINADGPWTVDISQPRPQNAQGAPISFSGMGQQVSQFFTLKSGLTRFEMVHDGTGYFGVWLTDSKGNNVDLLVNEVGTFDGSKATGIARDGIYCLDISADGNWKIDVSQ